MSSPSTWIEAFGILASSTKWLSQCGQYSSLPLVQQAHHGSTGTRPDTRDVRILKLARILSKGLFALFAYKDHVEGLHQRVVGLLGMALGAVEPFLAWP
jgi:hypothetical protein